MTISESRALDKIEQKAKEAECTYHGCGRSALYGLKQYFSFIPKELIIASTAAAGGWGASGGSCAAYCAGLLAIALKFDPWIEDTSPAGRTKRGLAKKLEYEFRDWFLEEFGATICTNIQERVIGRSWNLMDPEQMAEFLSLPSNHEKCGTVVGKSARMAAVIILKNSPL
jgi:hypothetical protein